ncbi:Ig-like domain-containing protein [Arthrobacter ginkgonis]
MSPKAPQPPGTVQGPAATRTRRGLAAAIALFLAAAVLAGGAPAQAADSYPARGQVTITASQFDLNFAGQPAAVLGLVAPVAPATAIPTGTVVVTSLEPGNPTSEETLTETGEFLAFVFPSVPGTRQFTVEYSGDANFAPATVTISYFIPVGPLTKTTLTAIPSGPIASGQEITFSAVVTDPEGRPMTPGTLESGGITFFDNGVELTDGVQVNEEWSATFTTSALGVGTHNITAHFESFLNFGMSTSDPVVVVVNPAGPAPVRGELKAYPTGTVAAGTKVKATALISPRTGSGTVTGYVQFYDWNTKVGAPVALKDGRADFVYGSLKPGKHVLQAKYLGSKRYAADFTSARTVQVQKAAQSIAPTKAPVQK